MVVGEGVLRTIAVDCRPDGSRRPVRADCRIGRACGEELGLGDVRWRTTGGFESNHMRVTLFLGVALLHPSAPPPTGCVGEIPPIRARAPLPGQACEWAFRLQEKFEETELESWLDGAHEGPRPPPAPRSTERSWEVTFADRFLAVGATEVDRIERTIERARGTLGTTTRHNDESRVFEAVLVAELDGMSFDLEREKDGRWKWEPAKDGPPLALDPDGLVVDLSLSDWAPEDPQAATWTIPAGALQHLFRPGGDMGWHTEGDALHRAGDAASPVEYGGEIRVVRAAPREGDPAGAILLELDVEVVATEDLREPFQRRVEREAQATGGTPESPLKLLETRTYRGAGTMAWDTRLGRAVQVDLALDVDVVWQREFTVPWPDGTRRYALALRSQGTTELSMRHTTNL